MANEETGQQEIASSEAVFEADQELTDGGTREERYLHLIISALRSCAQYKPMFGKGRKGGLTLEEFQQMYAADPFYHWVGLDSPLIYAAHKAAGGMTSIYRQLGIGSERVLEVSYGIAWIYQ